MFSFFFMPLVIKSIYMHILDLFDQLETGTVVLGNISIGTIIGLCHAKGWILVDFLFRRVTLNKNEPSDIVFKPQMFCNDLCLILNYTSNDESCYIVSTGVDNSLTFCT